jgi:hypothetical protein
LNAIDRHRDPHFDFADLPELAVSPPVVPEGISLTGMSPNDVKDSALRQRYEEAIERNREKAERYRFQTRLRKLHERLTQQAENFITSAYAPVPDDIAELMALVEKELEDSGRIQRIRQLYP